MQVYHDFFLVPGSRSTFPDTDPDPGQWYGSDRIRIRILNTGFLLCDWIINVNFCEASEIVLFWAPLTLTQSHRLFGFVT